MFHPGNAAAGTTCCTGNRSAVTACHCDTWPQLEMFSTELLGIQKRAEATELETPNFPDQIKIDKS